MSKLDVLRALSSDARLEILKLLYKKPHDIGELAEKTKLQPVTIRHHIRSLQEAGLLESYEVRTGLAGRPKTFYKIAKSLPMVVFPARQYQEFSNFLIKFLFQKLGNRQTSEMLTELGREMGKETVKYLEVSNNITEWTPEKFATVFVEKYLQEAGAEPEITEKTDNKVVFRIHNCVFFEISQKQPDLMCDVLHREFHKAIIKAMGKNIEGIQTNCMGHGDLYCDQVVKWKSKKKKQPKSS
jgi:predicted ArsR family transcriptional regulator